MRFLTLFILFSLSNAQEWFITNFEYGKMLYNNPRGISCAKCHGKRGEGKIITSFKENGKHIVIKTTPFKNLSFEFFKKALFHQLNIKKILKKDKNSPLKYIIIMPKYNYLTDSEIKAIIYYLKKVNK